MERPGGCCAGKFVKFLSLTAILSGYSGGVRGEERVAAPVSPSPMFTQSNLPLDEDERGLWMQADEAERELKRSNFVVRDQALNAYVKSVLCRAVGADRCGAARIYMVRTPHFNASMAPNGMMQVWTGLLLRVRNEAQLAAILAHEFAHFEQRHGVKSFKDIKAKTDAMAWLSFIPYGVGLLSQYAVAGSVFSFNRDMEREADAMSVRHLSMAGYAPISASQIWFNLRLEMDATALARNRRSRKDENGGFFATHPGSAERMADLAKLAAEQTNETNDNGEERYRAAISGWWPALIDDQIKRNDFGATDFLITQLAGNKWSDDLLYARAELLRHRGADGDNAKAADYYRQSIKLGNAAAEARRGLGLSLLKMGKVEEGRQYLREYVALRPNAGDITMINMLLGGI